MMDFSKFFDPSANKDGFTFGQPSAEYFAQPAINASTLKAPTPLEMLYKLRHEFDPLKYPLMFGSLVHKAILEPDDFDSDKRDSWLIILTTKSLTTKEAKSAHEANPGMVIATPEMVEKAARCKEAAWKHKQLRWCLEQPGNSEVSATAWNEATNCWRKCRIDWLPKDRTCGWILDLKTTMASVGSLWALNGEIRKWGYDISARHYTEIAAQLGHPCAHFAFAWIKGRPAFRKTRNPRPTSLA